MNLIKIMLDKQEELNNSTNGKFWKSGVNKHNKTINWDLCSQMECGELIGSFPWKHWKSVNADIDWQNVKMELIDIWHFLLSEILKTNIISEETIEKIYQKTEKNDEDLIKLSRKFIFVSSFDLLEELEDDLFDRIRISYLDEEVTIKLESQLKYFFQMVKNVDMSLEDIYKLYIGKNILNQFRQDNGYVEKTYIKEWNGKEDNVVLQEIMTVELNPDNIYKELEKVYKSL